jgi:2-amino-4-hydroxy-6-hydroxymethyldihydropteridine diphosphokinase
MVYLSLGSNLGKSAAVLKEAFAKITSWSEVSGTNLSSLYRTAPVSAVEQEDFINAVMVLETLLSPQDLMERCQALEKSYGIKEPIKDGPRALDIDLLFYGDLELSKEDLQLPHPRWKGRLFVLIPLRELTPRVNGVALDPLIAIIQESDRGKQRIDKLG